MSSRRSHRCRRPCKIRDPTSKVARVNTCFRPFQRFKSATVAHSGVNPHGGFTEFVKKDPINNIDTYRDSQPPPPDISYMSQRWAVRTSKYTATTGKVTEDGKLDRTQMKSTKAWTWRNPTDNISFEPPPAADRPL